MTEIAKFLSHKEKITVVCSSIQYDDNIDKEDLSGIYNIDILRVNSLGLNKNNIAFRIANSLYNSFALIFKIISTVRKNDTVLAVTNPFLLILLMAVIKKFKKFNYVLLVHDVFPENTIPAGLMKPRSIFYKVVRFIFNWAYSKANRFIVLGEDMKKLVARKVRSENNIFVIPNWFDEGLQLLHNFDRNNYTHLDLDGKVVIGFAGNIGRVQNLESFVNILSKVSNPNLVLTVVGDGASRKKIELFINKKKISNVHFLGSKPRHEQINFLNSCDIGLVTLAEGMTGLGVPSKIHNLMAIEKPVLYIGDETSEVTAYIRQYNCGWSFDWSLENELINFLNTISKETLQFGNLGKNAGSAAKLYFTQEVILNKISQVIR